MKKQHFLLLGTLATSLLTISSVTLAQPIIAGIITHAAVVNSTAIPTLSNTMLIIMSALIAIFAYRMIKNDTNSSKKIILSLFLVGLFSINNTALVNKVIAGSITLTGEQFFTSLTTTDIHVGDWKYTNNQGHIIKITDMGIKSGASQQCENYDSTSPLPTTTPRCVIGLEVGIGNSCGFYCATPGA